MGISRRVRALAMNALVWGGMYAVAGAVFTLLQSYWNEAPELSLVLEQTRWVSFRWAVIGAVSGGVFGIVFSWLERRRTFSELSLGRVALCGVAGGIAWPLLASVLAIVGPVPEKVAVGTLVALTTFGGMLGGACAAVCLGIARSGGSDSTAQRAALQNDSRAGSLPPGGVEAKVPWSGRGVRSSVPRT